MSEQFTGTVRVKDGNKAPQDFGVNREVEVSISFSTDTAASLEGITREAANVADAVVNEKLGRAPATEASAKVTQTRGTKKQPPAATTTADPAKVAPDPAKVETPKQEATKTADPAAMGSEPTVVPANGSGQAISTGAERKDPASLDDILSPVAPSQITDSHLMSAITRRNAETTNALAIRSLIGQYVPQDGNHHGAADIEQAKRQAFLLELDKVQKANA